MAKGKLTTNEKYTIQGMLHDKKSVDEIATALGRTQKTVQNYIDGELDRLLDTVAKTKTPAVDEDDNVPENVVKKSVVTISAEMYKEALTKLKINGFTPEESKKLLDRIVKTLEVEPASAHQLYVMAVTSKIREGNFIKNTSGGRDGVVIMTKEASEDGEKQQPTKSRTARGNVFNMKENRIE